MVLLYERGYTGDSREMRHTVRHTETRWGFMFPTRFHVITWLHFSIFYFLFSTIGGYTTKEPKIAQKLNACDLIFLVKGFGSMNIFEIEIERLASMYNKKTLGARTLNLCFVKFFSARIMVGSSFYKNSNQDDFIFPFLACRDNERCKVRLKTATTYY